MKLHIEQDPTILETEITVRCGEMDERLSALLRQIQLYSSSLFVQKDGRSLPLPLEHVFYFESVDNNTFVYCQAEVYECDLRLYELEDQLEKTSFCRVSKSALLNTAVVDSVRPMLGGRMEAQLQNGEKILVSRHYVPDFKAKFGLTGELL